MPRRPTADTAMSGELHILPEFREGLADISGFERIWVIVWMHQARGRPLRVHPPIDTEEHGVFTTRSPDRPNPIAMSCVKLQDVNEETGVLRVERIDLLDGTPILDIKPYIPESDAFPDVTSGWHARVRERMKDEDTPRQSRKSTDLEK